MMDRLGEDFDATVSGVTEWGIYAEIDENKCEGMISIRNLDDDMYEFDEDNYCVVGRGKGKKYQLGDHIRIRIANANLEKKQLDFVLAGSPLTSVEMQNQALRAKGIDPIQHERERALRHASEEKGRGVRHDGRRHDKGGVPSKGRVAASAKKGKKDKKDKKSKGKGKKSKK